MKKMKLNINVGKTDRKSAAKVKFVENLSVKKVDKY